MEESQVPADVSMEDKRQQSPPETDREHDDLQDSNSQCKVFVGGISRTTDEDEIYSIFSKYNPKEVIIMRELETQRPRGFGFISFGSQKDMGRAIDDMHNTRINGRVVTVSKARPFERPTGNRSPRRPCSPNRRPPLDQRRDGERNFPRRYQNHHQDHDNGQRPQHYDNRRRPHDQNISSRRHVHDSRKLDDIPPNPPHNYDNRIGRGEYGRDHEGRRGNYRQSSTQRSDDYHHSGHSDGGRQGQWMDYDRRQQMRHREEGMRRWNQNDHEKRVRSDGAGHYNNRNTQQRWRETERDDPRRHGGQYLDNRDDSDVPRGGNGHYGQLRRRGEGRRTVSHRQRSRSFDRRGR